MRGQGIEATESRLAASQNSKVIVIGSGKEGLAITGGLDTALDFYL
ncbi:MAG: hypothetical protein GH143_01860 [Calditrichaeota bacterium]|nr:hypothetical protein [Calditrichota bacterium]